MKTLDISVPHRHEISHRLEI